MYIYCHKIALKDQYQMYRAINRKKFKNYFHGGILIVRKVNCRYTVRTGKLSTYKSEDIVASKRSRYRCNESCMQKKKKRIHVEEEILNSLPPREQIYCSALKLINDDKAEK
ncbi:hypothetical protein T4D_4091 [Trichinella pseudospiralis]|uniref:Uncharacterized protein n=1 Tax=Trichinella pseudospiralis TaxID=6337 RepID=A0A0V1FFA3_TRIPS|nr:hypothetical protein T4D_4091 [Trichinella pseudospiralis]